MNAIEDPSEKILKVAKKLFYSQGYKNVTMDDIAKELRMSKKTIYKYHEGKYPILIQLITTWKETISHSIDSLLAEKNIAYSEKLKNFLILVGTALSDVSQVFMSDLQRNLPEIWEELTEYKRFAAYDRFLRLVKEGQDSGYVSPSVNINIVVALYASAIQNLLNPDFCAQLPKEVYAGFPEKPCEIFEQMISVLFEGVLLPEKKFRD